MSQNAEVQMTLDDAVAEVLGQLTGLDLEYDPRLDRYRAIVRQLNRATRAMALEHEWSWYADTKSVGLAVEGVRDVVISSTMRPRIINDDAVRLVDDNGNPVVWAYFLPRDAIHKYTESRGLWVSILRNHLIFSRPFNKAEAGLDVQVPVMREPRMFRLPDLPTDLPAGEELPQVPDAIRNQLVDFPYPDVVIARAAYYTASSDPVMQPRAQTLEAAYKDLMYQLIERDTSNTDTPYVNDYRLDLHNSVAGGDYFPHQHPHSDWR